MKILIAKRIPLDERIRETMKMRLENPSCTLAELAEKLFISRDGLKYRLKKIHLLAKKFGKR